MTNNRLFHLGDILSITTSRLVSLRHIDGVYDILNYMTDDNLFTHQLPRASAECAPHILAQHPQLENVDVSMLTAENHKEWLNKQIAKFGEELPIKPLVLGIHIYKDPIEEAEEMCPGKVIYVNVFKEDAGPNPKLN